MLIREFTFGDTPCEVHIDEPASPGGFAQFTARPFVQEHDGRELRRVGDPEGTPVTFEHADAGGALALTSVYLEERCGPLRGAPTPRVGPRAVPTIIEPPLTDARTTE